jgi:precorrin-6Y C5,15-methyltransferase (decarboxylating)
VLFQTKEAGEIERHKLYVVSVGPGGEEHLTRAAESVLKTADCVVTAKRHLDLVKGRVLPLEGLDEAIAKIAENLKKGSVAVAVSGDAGIFSLMPRLKRALPDQDIAVIPGVSALQFLCAALGETWDGAETVSLHGRDVSPSRIAGIAAHNKKTFFFCGPGHDPGWLCRLLAERGIEAEIAVGERLSYPDGRVVEVKAPFLELSGEVFDPLSVVMVRNPDPLPLLSLRPKDEDFLRSPSVPMTRGEVRTVILDKLSTGLEAVVWDVGAGTGSVAVACSRLCPYGEVHAVERLPEAADLLRTNKENFRAYNLFVHEGEAEILLETLPRPTHVFVGGSGGMLRKILGHVKKLGEENEKIFVLVSGVTLKTITTAYEVFSGEGFSDLDVTQIAVSRSRSAGDSVILAAQNPITLLSAYTGKGEGRIFGV